MEKEITLIHINIENDKYLNTLNLEINSGCIFLEYKLLFLLY